MVQIASFALCVSVLSTLTCALPAFDQRIALGESVGVSYYVSSIHGSDTNSGVSPTEPWKTLNHTSNMMYAVAAPKTNLFLERGSVWVGIEISYHGDPHESDVCCRDSVHRLQCYSNFLSSVVPPKLLFVAHHSSLVDFEVAQLLHAIYLFILGRCDCV